MQLDQHRQSFDGSGAITLTPICNLKPAARNARTHSKKQIAQIARSIENFGFTNPVLIDNDGRIVAGHGRVEAAKLLKMAEVPTRLLNHLTPDELRLYALTDNRLAELAGWDEDLLALELEEISALTLDFELDITGFDLPAIDLMIQERQREPDPEDAFIEEPQSHSVVSRLGDVWLLGNHKIVCGNSLNSETYSTLLGDEKAEMVLADPPYNVRVNGHVSGLGSAKHDEFQMASGEMTDEQFSTFLETVAARLVEASVEGCLHFICIDWRHVSQLITSTSRHYRTLVNLCVWDKGQGGMGSLYRSQHELIAIFKAGREPHINNIELGKHGRNRTNIWRYPGANAMSRGRQRKLSMHPTIKPVALVADAILDASHRHGVVLDAFGGSGATLLAAERTGRRARLIEIDPKYVDVTIERWQRMTKRCAVLSTTGRTFDAVSVERAGEPTAAVD